MKIKGIVFLGFALVSLACAGEVFADKSSVKIEAPQVAEKGAEIVIKILVFHKGNNFIHYTNWVEVKIDDKPAKRWTFSASDRPEGENFTRELTYRVTEPVTIVAEANCVLHGSEGPATRTVSLASAQTEKEDKQKESKP
jgi:desulfoferrodoxin (superoxide reductase-like protein)